MTVEEAHDVGGHVRAEVRRRLPWVADVLVHIEPANAPSLLPARPPRREVIADRE